MELCREDGHLFEDDSSDDLSITLLFIQKEVLERGFNDASWAGLYIHKAFYNGSDVIKLENIEQSMVIVCLNNSRLADTKVEYRFLCLQHLPIHNKPNEYHTVFSIFKSMEEIQSLYRYIPESNLDIVFGKEARGYPVQSDLERISTIPVAPGQLPDLNIKRMVLSKNNMLEYFYYVQWFICSRITVLPCSECTQKDKSNMQWVDELL